MKVSVAKLRDDDANGFFHFVTALRGSGTKSQNGILPKSYLKWKTGYRFLGNPLFLLASPTGFEPVLLP